MKNIHKQFVEKYSNAVTDMKKTKILKLPYHSNGKKTERWLERKKKPRTFKSCMLNLKCKKITAKKSSVVIQSRHWIIQVQYRDYTHVWQGFACLGPNKAMLRTQQGTQVYRLSALSGYIHYTAHCPKTNSKLSIQYKPSLSRLERMQRYSSGGCTDETSQGTKCLQTYNKVPGTFCLGTFCMCVVGCLGQMYIC